MKTLLLLLFAMTAAYGQTLINGSRTIAGTANYCEPSGGTDTYGCPIVGLTAYATGSFYSFKADVANTDGASINFTAIGAKTIVKVQGGVTTALATNDIRAGQVVDLKYDGTNMQMQSTLGNAPAGGGGSVNGVANATLFFPFAGASYATSQTITGSQVYLFSSFLPHWTQTDYAKMCAGIATVAASGKALAVGVFAKAANGDITLLAGTKGFVVDSTTVSAGGGRCGTVEDGTLVSGGVATIGARGDLVMALCSDGSPNVVAHGSSISTSLNEVNQVPAAGQKMTAYSSAAPCTGTGTSLAFPSTITNANIVAYTLQHPLVWFKR